MSENCKPRRTEQLSFFDSTTASSGTNQPYFTPLKSEAIHAALLSDATLITANQRLSRFRMQQFEHHQITDAAEAWPTPNILPWSAWLQKQWASANLGVMLNPQQESLLWQRVIAEDDSIHVLQDKALSKQAMEAWQIMTDYLIPDDVLQTFSEEHQALRRWGQAVIKKSDHYFRHHVQHQLSHTSSQTIPKTIIMDGFDSYSPAQLRLLAHLESLGSTVMEVDSSYPKAAFQLISYRDEEDEMRQVCQRIIAHRQAQPGHQIGVLIFDLERKADMVTRIFTEELAPQLQLLPECDLQGDYFNISLGSPLAKQPMIEAAFRLLDLSITHQWNVADYSAFLLCPYMHGYAIEKFQRAALDIRLRKKNIDSLTIKTLLQSIDNMLMPKLFDLLNQSQSLADIGFSLSGKQTLSHWVVMAESLLKTWSWYDQDDATLQKHERAQIQNWRELMEQLTSLDDYAGHITWREAIALMKDMAFDHVFRSAPGHAQVQVMGILESRNLRFDHAFILGMDDNTWPAAAKPHPLIPMDIQVKYQTPHANSEREWAFAESVWHHLQYIAPKVDISYATTQDHHDNQPSPFVLHLLTKPATQTQRPSSAYTQTLQQHPAPLSPMPTRASPVHSQEKIRGGTSLLTAQAACSFQAFARFRLNLKGIESPGKGLNSRDQGIVLHDILEKFWNKHHSHNQLVSLINNAKLDEELEQIIAASYTCLDRQIDKETWRLEAQRLLRLTHDWLKMEAARPAFRVVELEQQRDLQLGELLLHNKLDRIDIDNQGHRIILDYKTGQATPNQALGTRPDAPQLPAYWLAEENLGNPVDALAFAQVRHDNDMGFKGFAKEAGILPKINAFKGKAEQPDNWADLTSHWREVLNTLADEFLAGEAAIAPKSAQSCTYCDFAGLCRIAEKETHTQDNSSAP